MRTKEVSHPERPGAFDVPGFCQAYNVSRSTFYEETKAGRLRTFAVGRRRLVSYEAAEDWRRLLERESARPSKPPSK